VDLKVTFIQQNTEHIKKKAVWLRLSVWVNNLSCWIRDSSNKRTYISSFLSFFWLIPSNMDRFQRLPKNMLRFSKGHLLAIISSGNILWKTWTMSVQLMKERWLFTMFNVKASKLY
jgi:hypothetical protein